MALTTDYIQQERPPYIEFERRSVERYKPREEGGELYYVDVDFVLIMPRGGKDVIDKEVSAWFESLEIQRKMERINPEWYRQYKEGYELWKKGQSLPVDGTPIRMWPAIGPSEVKLLLELRLHTVEDVAASNEETIGRLGMGARSLVQKAKDWLTAKTDTAPLVQRLDAMQASLNAMSERNKQLAEENEEFKRREKYAVPAPAVAVTNPPTEDLSTRLARAQDKFPTSDDLIEKL